MAPDKKLTLSLGKQQASIDKRVASGAYASAEEVIRAALRALEREEAAVEQMLLGKVQQAIDDPGPSIHADHLFHHLRRMLKGDADEKDQQG